jgi:hypothetical protein
MMYSVTVHPWEILHFHILECAAPKSTSAWWWQWWSRYRECVGSLLHEGGVRRFFTGLPTRLRQSISPAALGFLVYELALKRYEEQYTFHQKFSPLHSK